MNPVVRKVAKGSWRAVGRVTPGFRALPDFLIIGTQKGGTSSLLNYLAQHPAVARPMTKEVHYFVNHYDRGLDWYRSHFATRLWLRVAGKAAGARVQVGEATPCYLAHPRAAGRAAAVLPGAKLIAMLRNPVDRAYSHYKHRLRWKTESLPSLAEAIDAEEARLAAMRDDPSVDEARYEQAAYASYLNRGKYVDQLLSWERHYPRGQMLVVRSEDFFDDPRTVFLRVLEFLELPLWEPREYRKYNYFGEYEAIDAATRERLNAFYAPYNRRLFEHLGEDYGWPA
jgi:Sulfotransferase domain